MDSHKIPWFQTTTQFKIDAKFMAVFPRAFFHSIRHPETYMYTNMTGT
jgi:hypothetical protein